MCTPTIMIDGAPQRRPWGTHSIPLTPGMHNITVYFRYLFLETCGFNQINVVVQPNCVHRIKYEMGLFVFSPGAIREISPPFQFQ